MEHMLSDTRTNSRAASATLIPRLAPESCAKFQHSESPREVREQRKTQRSRSRSQRTAHVSVLGVAVSYDDIAY